MGWFGLLTLAVALAMDAFAVAIVTTLALEHVTARHVFRLCFHFGWFQAVMLTLGWAFGELASNLLRSADHWVAFGLLAFVGGRMIAGAGEGEGGAIKPDRTRGWGLVALSVATSVDALAVGLSLALLGGSIVLPATVVGAVAAGLTAVGMLIGRRLGTTWGQRLERVGGAVLLGIGLRILVTHLLGQG